MAKKNNKKGQLEIQFNWIFVIIIGAVILGFLLTFIFSQGDANDKKVSASIANNFETIITSTNQKIGTVKSYKVPDVDINFVCDQDQGLYYYSIGGVNAKDTKHELIFSSEHLRGTRIFTWTEKWSVPYQVATFLYITNDREHFSFVTSYPQTSLETDLIENFADNLSISILNQSATGFENVPSAGLNKMAYTFVVVDDLSNSPLPDPNDFIQTPHDRTRIILINPKSSSNIFESGKVAFLDFDTYKDFANGNTLAAEDETSSYFGKASLYASIFAGNKERYECGMSKAMSRLQLVTLMQYYKTISVEPYISSACKSYIIGSDFDEALWGARLVLKELNVTIADSDFGVQSADDIIGLISKLKNLNNKIVVESNCPLIY